MILLIRSSAVFVIFSGERPRDGCEACFDSDDLDSGDIGRKALLTDFCEVTGVADIPPAGGLGLGLGRSDSVDNPAWTGTFLSLTEATFPVAGAAIRVALECAGALDKLFDLPDTANEVGFPNLP